MNAEYTVNKYTLRANNYYKSKENLMEMTETVNE